MIARWIFVLGMLMTPWLFAQETPAPPPDSKSSGDIKLEDWNKEDWMLIKPKLSLFEMDGYFRMRAYLFRRLDFGNGSQTEIKPRYGYVDPTTHQVTSSGSFSTANLRLRLDPKINVTENIQIFSTIDVLDNLSLGSTADTVPTTNGQPVNVLSISQNGVQRGFNSVSDAILIRRLYARVTALSEQLEFRFGRMPDHWGLGMMANSGDCIDCDFGHTVDRVMGTFKAANILFQPMFDWVYTGPAALPFGSGSAIDSLVWDDTVQYSLRILRQDHPDEIQERITHGDTVINFGLWNAVRTQSRDQKSAAYKNSDGQIVYNADGSQANSSNYERRDAVIYKGDGYAQIYHEQFELGLEGAVIAGKFRDLDENNNLQTTKILQYGAALEAVAKPRAVQGLHVSLKSGIASGDSAPGYGALDQAATQRGDKGITKSTGDHSLNNFQFSPDYHLDLLMFRRIVGTVTDAWYVRPEVAYLFDKKVLGRLWLVYSQAMYRNSTSSCMAADGTSLCTGQTAASKGSRPMGLEVDTEVAYGVGFWDRIMNHGLKAAVNFGMLFPFGAFQNYQVEQDNGGKNPHFAWTIQGRVYLTF